MRKLKEKLPICDYCGTAQFDIEDTALICDGCLTLLNTLEKENAELRAENVRLRDMIGPYCGV